MTGNRGIWRRPYFFEVFTIANFIVIYVLVSLKNQLVLTTIPATFASLVPVLAGYALAGVLVRAVVAYFRGELPAYLRVIRSAGWLLDTARYVIFGALMVHTYFWIKLMVPLMHPELFDQQLWNLDQAMLFGHSPNVLFLDLLSNPTALRVIDWSYARIFFASMALAFSFFLSSPSRRLRAGFSTGSSLLWMTGAWLYLLIPSIGPAYSFPDVWAAAAPFLELSRHFQAVLMKSYRAVLQLPAGGSTDNVQLMFGVAAFPSLHVAFQTFAFLWMRRLWIYGQIVFGLFAFVILIGSVITGWHYLIDGLAGMAMALFCYDISLRLWSIRRWRRLRARQKLLALSS